MSQEMFAELIQRHLADWGNDPWPPRDLPDSDGVPLETEWHRLAMNVLIESIVYHFRDRQDFYAGGNMFLYFSPQQVRNNDFRGPDFFFVWGIQRKIRRYWAIWDENYKCPNVIIELTSPTTAVEDHTVKKTIYEGTLHTPEYFIYDPDAQKLEGWRLSPAGQYEDITPDDRGRLWCEQLNMWVGTYHGKYLEMPALYLRFFEPDGQLVMTGYEAEKQRAEAEKQRAEAEKQRAEAAEVELARLRAKLAELESKDKPAS
jgi:Uma2 family endonuclease